MQRELIYYVSLVIFGVVAVANGVQGLLTDGASVSVVLLGVGGAGVVGAVAVQWAGDSDPPSNTQTWITAGCAALYVIGSIPALLL